MLIKNAIVLIDEIDSNLKKGIEQYTFVLHGKSSKKEIISSIHSILETKHVTSAEVATLVQTLVKF